MKISNNNLYIEISSKELEESKFLKTLLSMNFLKAEVHPCNEKEEKEVNYEVAIKEEPKGNTNTETDDLCNFLSLDRIPNSSDFLDNKFPKSIIDEHFDEDGEKIDLHDLELKRDESIILKDFSCPDCHQGTIAMLTSDNENKILFMLEDTDTNTMCLLDESYAERFATHIGSTVVNLDEIIFGSDIVKQLYKELKEDNSKIIDSHVYINVPKEHRLSCPVCETNNNVSNWVKAAKEAKIEKKCRYCGSEKWLNVDTGELECENKKCYCNTL